MSENPKAYTVSAITRIIKNTLEDTLKGIWIEGEISNYLHHSSGHRYFNLKDDRAVLKVTLWKSAGAYLKFEPENGQKVLVYGDITVYEKGGNYQLNCRKIVPVGVGELELFAEVETAFPEPGARGQDPGFSKFFLKFEKIDGSGSRGSLVWVCTNFQILSES